METKICKKCKTEKLLSEFNANPHTVDKRVATCKNCMKKYLKARYRAIRGYR